MGNFKTLVFVVLVLGGCGGVFHHLAQPPAYPLEPPRYVAECQQLAASRGFTLAQFAGRMIVLNVIRSVWALNLFHAVGAQCACTLVRCEIPNKVA
jgi:hypothetical protein